MKYRKLPIEIKIERATENQTIDTLEGTQDVKEGDYIATGVKGELYAFSEEKFLANYEPVEGREGYYVKRSTAVVDAIQMDFPIEIFRPDWQHKGKAGDYLLYAGKGDQYVCDQEVFLQTYVPVED